MDEIAVAFAKLAGTRKALTSILQGPGTLPSGSYAPRFVERHFWSASDQLRLLKTKQPQLYDDLWASDPELLPDKGKLAADRYDREVIVHFLGIIDQALEIRAHSELASSEVKSARESRVFISHGRASDWREVQAYIEKDIGISTLELAQEANMGRTILQKLEEEAHRCSFAVIVMTGDDTDGAGNPRARENVVHEIGYFQALYGLSGVCLLHEEGVSIPSNIHGLVYIPFPKSMVSATFGLLHRELKAFYRR